MSAINGGLLDSVIRPKLLNNPPASSFLMHINFCYHI